MKTQCFAEYARFLSSNAQDFIEEEGRYGRAVDVDCKFLSSNAQDFIEESANDLPINFSYAIPEQ